MNKGLPKLPNGIPSKYIRILVPIIICVLSLMILRPLFTNVGFYSASINSLDEKKGTVTKLLASSTTTSALLTLIPEDVCSPIAQKLADLSVVFTFILSVLYAEKYLMPILGGLTSSILIPLMCISYFAYRMNKAAIWLKNVAIKLAILSLACMFIIPTGIYVSDTVETIFKYSIDSAINAALDGEKKIEGIDEALIEQDTLQEEQQDEEEKGFFGKIGDAATSVVHGVTDTAQNVISGVSDFAKNVISGVSDLFEVAKIVLGNFVEAIAILLITSCLIPFLVFVAFIKVIKYVFSLNFSTIKISKDFYSSYKKKRDEVFHSDSISE